MKACGCVGSANKIYVTWLRCLVVTRREEKNYPASTNITSDYELASCHNENPFIPHEQTPSDDQNWRWKGRQQQERLESSRAVLERCAFLSGTQPCFS